MSPGDCRIALGEGDPAVVRLDGTAAALRDQHGELPAVMPGCLLTSPGSPPPDHSKGSALYTHRHSSELAESQFSYAVQAA